MAFNLQKINPLDLQPRKAVGVNLPFTSREVFTPNYSTKDAIKSNLINFFLTDKGERYLNLEFGCGLRRLLFSQTSVDTEDQVSFEVRKGLSEWFPNVILNRLDVISSPDQHSITVRIAYSVALTNIVDELVINFEQ